MLYGDQWICKCKTHNLELRKKCRNCGIIREKGDVQYQRLYELLDGKIPAQSNPSCIGETKMITADEMRKISEKDFDAYVDTLVEAELIRIEKYAKERAENHSRYCLWILLKGNLPYKSKLSKDVETGVVEKLKKFGYTVRLNYEEIEQMKIEW